MVILAQFFVTCDRGTVFGGIVNGLCHISFVSERRIGIKGKSLTFSLFPIVVAVDSESVTVK